MRLNDVGTVTYTKSNIGLVKECNQKDLKIIDILTWAGYSPVYNLLHRLFFSYGTTSVCLSAQGISPFSRG